MATWAISRIASYAREFGLTELDANHVRYFRQPLASVDRGIDIDLATGTLVRYPENSSKQTVRTVKADLETFTRLKGLLESDAFKLLPAENFAWGYDGLSDFIEVNLNGVYYWKCHWGGDDKILRKIVSVLSTLYSDLFIDVRPTSTMACEAIPWITAYANSHNTGKDFLPLQSNHARFFVQELGFVNMAVAIDLNEGTLVKYPYAPVGDHPFEGGVEQSELATLVGLLSSKAFKDLASENSAIDDDAEVFFIETNFDGVYSWKCHSAPESAILVQIRKLLESLLQGVKARHLLKMVNQYEGMARHPGSWMGHEMLSYALLLQGKIPEAIIQSRESVRLKPDDGRPWSLLARTLFANGKVREAITCFEKSLELMPDYPETLYYYGCALEQAGDASEAQQCFNQAFSRSRDYAVLHILAGNKLLKTGQYEKAVTYYKQALIAKPNYTPLRFNLGRALEHVGNVHEAIKQYDYALRMRPDFERARTALNRLAKSV